jgi:hypothetical protein
MTLESDLVIIGYMSLGVIVNIILDPVLSFVRSALGVDKVRGFGNWLSHHKKEVKLVVAILGLSLMVSFIMVWAIGIRPSDPSSGFLYGFTWTTVLDKAAGKKTFSSKTT